VSIVYFIYYIYIMTHFSSHSLVNPYGFTQVSWDSTIMIIVILLIKSSHRTKVCWGHCVWEAEPQELFSDVLPPWALFLTGYGGGGVRRSSQAVCLFYAIYWNKQRGEKVQEEPRRTKKDLQTTCTRAGFCFKTPILYWKIIRDHYIYYTAEKKHF